MSTDTAFDVEFVTRDERSARVLIRGLTPATANGVRRAVIADVPTFSIDSVRFVENSSVMFDEMVALRLGLVPLTTPLGEFEIGDTVTFSLDIEGPATAYSGDLVSSDEMVVPADDDVPIIELKEGQRLEFEADAVLDTGKEHAKHQGGVAVGYRHLQRVVVEGDRDEFAEEESRIIRGVIETEDGELVHTDEFDNDLTNRYPEQAVRVEDVPGAFVFHVESDGSVSVEDLLTEAVDTIRTRADELAEKVAV
ncbi:MAG: DNA-directed RNA polymerase subunit D [Halobaculum sp.]